MHGGNIQVECEGVGSQSGLSWVNMLTKAAPQPVGHLRRLRVLVVDDDLPSVLLMAKLFKMMGHEIRTATDGLEALEVAAAFKPELVLLNIDMPKLDGYETCRRIRREAWGQGMVVVAVTGYNDDGSSRKAGFNLHVVKPVDLDTFLKIAAGVPTPG